MKKNGQFLVGTIVVITAVLYFTAHITYVLREPTLEKTNLMGFYAEEKNSLDVVFIGSSTLRSSINPIDLYKDFGMTSYVIATSSQRPSAILYFLKEAQKFQKDAVYVLDINLIRHDFEVWNEQNEGSLRHITDGLKYSYNRALCINDIVPQKKVEYLFDIVKYHDNIKTQLNWEDWNFERNNPWKGFNMLTTAVYLESTYGYNEEEGFLPGYGEEILKKLLEYCKKEKVKVEFVITLNPSIDYQTCHYIKKVIESNGFPCFIFNDYQDIMSIDYSSDFYDAVHPNVLGARKCTSLYGKYLVDKYEFKEKKDNELIKKWNDDITSIFSELEEGIEQTEKSAAAKIGNITASINIYGNNVYFENTTFSLNTLEYAWHIYEELDDGGEYLIYSTWYTDENSLEYSFEAEKNYRIVFFVRVAGDQETGRWKTITTLIWDENNNAFILEQ